MNNKLSSKLKLTKIFKRKKHQKIYRNMFVFLLSKKKFFVYKIKILSKLKIHNLKNKTS